MKKILIFALSYYPKPVGGAEVAIKEITDRIDSDEYEFHLITNRFDSEVPKKEQFGNVLVHRIGITTKNPKPEDLISLPLHLNKLFYQIWAYVVAKRLHKQHHYDGIWAMMAYATGVPAGLFKKKFPEVTYILNLQEGDPTDYMERKMRFFGPLFKNGFVYADILQSISTFLEVWGKNMGVKGKTYIIPNGVDTEVFSTRPKEELLQEVQQRLHKKGGDVWLVTSSRLVHKNGIDDVVRSLVHLPEHVSFVVCGSGPDEHMLRDLATKLGVDNRVHFLGYVEHEEMITYMHAADIFIRPSRSEGMGSSFVEAMAARLPVIATQEGGIADFLFDRTRNPDKETTGWAVDVDNPEQIANAVTDIIDDTNNTQKVVATAHQLAVTKYNWDSLAEEMRAKVLKQI